MRARIAANTLHGNVDSGEHMRPAQAASPGQLAYWLRDVPTDLPDAERVRRAECLRSAHMARLALASSKARRARKKA
jgi:hypothetical protein